MNETQFGRGLQHLAANGLNLVAVFDCEALPVPIRAPIEQGGIDLRDYQRLVLVGNAGRQLWQALQQARQTTPLLESDDPVDDFSRLTVEQTVRDHLADAPMSILYPGDIPIPLQRLGQMAGWHHDSPLGLGIHEMHGPWFAYRAAFLIDAPLPLRKGSPTRSPCESCRTHDCVAACPAGAVSFEQAIDTHACITHALTEGSPCRTRCLAREACPVAPQSRYERAQIRYHYERAIAAIEQYWR
jgi:hypothetical protein